MEYEPITVRVEADRLSITSCPGPDRSITENDLAEGRLVANRYRNRRIGDFLKELHLIEGRNTGVPTMLRVLEANGSRPPLFETDEERSFFRVTFFLHEAFVSDPSELPEKTKAPARRTKEALRAAVLEELKNSDASQRELALRITIPASVRSAIGVKAGDRILFVCEDDGRVSLYGPNIQVLHAAQEAFAGAAERAGLQSTDDVVALVSEIHAEKAGK